QDLISAAELLVFLLQLRDPLLIIGRGPGPHPAVDFRLLRPGPQRLRVNTQLTGDPGQFPVALTLSFPDLEQHLHRAFAQLIRVFPLCRHDPASSQVSWPPRFPGWPNSPQAWQGNLAVFGVRVAELDRSRIKHGACGAAGPTSAPGSALGCLSVPAASR